MLTGQKKTRKKKSTNGSVYRVAAQLKIIKVEFSGFSSLITDEVGPDCLYQPATGRHSRGQQSGRMVAASLALALLTLATLSTAQLNTAAGLYVVCPQNKYLISVLFLKLLVAHSATQYISSFVRPNQTKPNIPNQVQTHKPLGLSTYKLTN